jgi:hypothetical protein
VLRGLRAALALAALAAASGLCGGCQFIGFTLYALKAEEKEVIKPDYNLKPAAERKATMLIRVWADPIIEMEHERACHDIALAIRGTLLQKDSPLKGLQIKKIEAVEQYIASRRDGSTLSPEQLSAHFDCDVVMDVSLTQYSILAPDSTELFQARIDAEIGVYDFTKSRQNLMPAEKRRVHVEFPREPADIKGDSEWRFWSVARGMFADKIYKKLHQYERERLTPAQRARGEE